MTRRGFTLLEFMLAIAIFSVLVAISIVVAFNAIARMNLRSSETALVQMIRRAQTQAQQNVDGKKWGVHLVDAAGVKTIVLFAGDAYATRVAGSESPFLVNANISFGGTLYAKMNATAKGLVFQRFTGAPVESSFFSTPTDGVITLTMHGSVRRIRMNSQGVVERR